MKASEETQDNFLLRAETEQNRSYRQSKRR